MNQKNCRITYRRKIMDKTQGCQCTGNKTIKAIRTCRLHLLLGTFVLTVFLSGAKSQGSFDLQCPNGWELNGAHCYKLFKRKLEYQDAQLSCIKYGAKLVDIYGFEDNRNVASLANAGDEFWIEARQNGSSVDESEGFWDAFQPMSSISGKTSTCVKVARNDKWYYRDPWAFTHCKEKLPYICKATACVKDSYRCTNGKRCINPSLKCDDSDDCGDFSDETDCPSKCRHVLTGRTGILKSKNYPSDYAASSDCQWLIEAPPDVRIALQFTAFNTESGVDKVTIYVGGKTELTSAIYTSLSGSYSTEQLNNLLPIVSPNNLMIIRFTSDGSTQATGFSATYGPDYKCHMMKISGHYQRGNVNQKLSKTASECMTECLKTTACDVFHYNKTGGYCETFRHVMPAFKDPNFDYYGKVCPGEIGNAVHPGIPENGGVLTAKPGPMPGFLQSEFFPFYMLGNMRTVWNVKTETPLRKIITFELQEMNIGSQAYVEIRDGDSPSSPLLAKYTANQGPTIVMTTSSKARVYFNSKNSEPRKGFQFWYRQGCDVKLTSSFGEIQSPGYPSLQYPSYQRCSWTIQPQAPQSMLLTFDVDFELKDGDYLMVYAGKNSSGSVLLNDTASTTAPANLVSQEGSFYIVMTTNAIRNGKGWKASYATNCESLSFNSSTTTVVGSGNSFRDERNVSCLTGYEFSQEEHRNASVVQLKCTGNGWNVYKIPTCKPVYCGQPPAVTNGFVKNSTGVTFNDSVTYDCYGGFAISVAAPIKCQSDGMWTTPPTCQSTNCTSLSDIPNGNKTLEFLDGISYSSIVKFRCSAGYQLEGVPILQCLSGGNWSNSGKSPTCKKLKCLPPSIKNGNVSSSSIEYEDVVTVTCDAGFQINGSVVLECMANQMFNASTPMCQDIDECKTNRHDCEQTCINTVGGYRCTCTDGYTQNSTQTNKCDNVNECSTNNGGCNPGNMAHCNDLQGSYFCSCPTGYELYSENGTSNLYQRDSRNVYTRGDVSQYHINHTCVRKLCPKLSEITNGKVLSNRADHQYEDVVTFMCDLGYVLNGSANSTCQSDGSWTNQQPTCVVATCQPLNLSGLDFPPDPTYSSDPLVYGSNVTLTCNHSRPTPLIFQRQCVYDMASDSYAIQDADLDCPVINCGTPVMGSGQIPPSATPKTTRTSGDYFLYGSSYTFNCSDSFTKIGNNSVNTDEVKCMADGYWDVGDLRCEGKTCTDPGRPADGIQDMSRSDKTYEKDKLIYFKCQRPGFDLSFSTPFKCEVSNNVAKWNESKLPECVDVERPVFTNCPDNGTLYISPLTAPNFTKPEVTDNADVASIEVSPSTFRPNQVLKTGLNVTYTAKDHANNTAECVVVIMMKDINPPEITCPTSYAVQVSENITQTVMSNSQPANATDNSGEAPTITYSPATFDVSHLNFSTSVSIMATATDGAGNTASCTFAVAVESAPCNPYTLPEPKNGTKKCVETDTGYDCLMTCNLGHHFYNGSTNQTWSCTNGKSWLPSAQVDPCQVPEKASYSLMMGFTYNPTAGSTINKTACEDSYRAAFLKAFSDVSKKLTDQCTTQLDEASPGRYVELNENFLRMSIEENKVSINTTVFIRPNNLSDAQLSSCGNLARFQLVGVTVYKSTKPLETVTPSVSDCPPLLTTLDGALQQKPLFQCPNNNEKLIEKKDDNICLRCPAGTFTDNAGDCQPCPIGTFSITGDAGQCTPCPAGMWTRETRSQEVDCIPDCSAVNMVSATRVMPCNGCPKDTYALNSTHCEKCPDGMITRGTGNYNASQCLAVCEPGTFSVDGYQPCKPCPHNFYQSAAKSMSCDECSAKRITINEGANNASLCVDGDALLCGTNACQNNGTCQVQNHIKMCTCATGYTGPICETNIDDCASSPCYYGATCRDKLNSFECDCPTNSKYNGSRCEEEQDDCMTADCSKNGMCQDGIATFTCLCKDGYQGDKCDNTTRYCEGNQGSCNNGTCINVGQTGHKCACTPGYTGKTCDQEIDECQSTPCLYGGKCENLINDYKCQCPEGFTGKNCQIRPDVCTGTCGNTGSCCDDYRSNQAICVCQDGYQRNVSLTAGSLIEKIEGVNYGKCSLEDLCARFTPCMNGGSCAPGVGYYRCSCPAGFTGLNCEVNVDECASDPCQNSGQCTDQVDGFMCTCPDGYNGTLCEIDINECEPLPCDNVGTEENGCVNLINDFRCRCKAGYTGKQCEVNVNDCAVNPCLHGGTCTDLVAGFSCNCTDGWTGQTCGQLVEKCDASSCSNQAACLNTFNSIFCSCKSPYYGDTCSEQESICRDVNPCLNNANCSQSGQEAKCLCNPGYSGEGCQLDTHFCIGDICNGGTCLSTSEGAKCQCLKGYEGDRCENVIDSCRDVQCDAGTCVNGQCQCPPGKTGSKCDKDVQFDADFYFYNPAKTGQAFTPLPFLLNSSSLSVGLWLRYEKPGDTGTVLSLYGMSSRNANSEKTLLMKIDESNVILNFGGNRKTQPLRDGNNNSLNINDGQWKYLLASWDRARATFEITIGLVAFDLEFTYTTSEMLPKYGWVTLGNDYDVENDISIPDKGFNGYITRVNVFNRFVDNVGDRLGTSLRNKTHAPVFEDDLLLAWTDYSLQGGVRMIRPAFTTKSSGRPEVEITCPEDVFTTSSKRLTTVSWNSPTQFKPQSQKPVPSHDQKSPFIWGRYTVMYRIADANGNTATCSFYVFIKKEDCTRPLISSTDAAPTCSDTNSRQFRTCTPNCPNEKRYPVKSPVFFTCGPQGSFNVFNKFLPFVLPVCAPARVNDVDVKVKLQYKGSGCSGPVLKRIKGGFTDLDKAWKNGLCKGQPCETFLDQTFDSSCPDKDLKVEFIFKDIKKDQQSAVSRLTVDQVLLQSLLDFNDFNFTDKFSGGAVDLPTVDVIVTPSCHPGEVFIKDRCVTCGPGTMYNAKTLSCDLCPIGQYQEKYKQSSCDSCPNGEITRSEGSTNLTDCKVSCKAGNFYNETMCSPCAKGFYQEKEGQFYCDPCSAGNTTAGEGSVSSGDCFEVCDDGTELQTNGDCQPCPRGTYRKHGFQDSCETCPQGKTTPGNKSVLVTECNITICNAGHFRNTSNQCEACPQGQYQPMALQDSCERCNATHTTLQEGSVNASQCVFFCKGGYEIYPSGTENCRECLRGFYKEEANLTGSCAPCHADYVTPTNASISEDNCTVANCSAGQERNITSNACQNCPKGFYQPMKWQTKCEPCPNDKSTPQEGAKSLDECKLSCPPGKQDVNGTCTNCTIGSYKASQGEAPCEPCGESDTKHTLLTPATGATSNNSCIIEKCFKGEERNNNNKCMKCAKGSYNEKDDGSACTRCPNHNSKPKVTFTEGSTNLSQCVLDCKSGEEYDSASESCKPCERGFYRNKTSEDQCTLCPGNKITAATRSEDMAECTVANCTAGEERNATTEQCMPCQKGWYQEQKWQDRCVPCGTDKTTPDQGSRNKSDCVQDCAAGKEPDASGEQCVPCQRGYYRDKSSPDPPIKCQICSPEFITLTNGAKSRGECNVGNCTAGYKLEANKCVKCPRNQYQDTIWQTECKVCPRETPASDEATMAVTDCYSPCEAGKHSCHKNAACAVKGTNASCTCNQGYNGNGYVCSDLCDVSYCLNGATCTSRVPQLPICSCTDRWEGPRCQSRKEPVSMSPIIIGGAVGGVTLLLLLMLLCLGIGICARKAKKPIETNIMNPIYEPLPGMNKPPQRFGSVAGSMRSFANMQPALAATGAPSMSGFSHRSKYLFYEDVDDTPIKMGSVYSPSIAGNTNRPPLPGIYEEKTSKIDFGNEDEAQEGVTNPVFEPDDLYSTVER